MVEVIRSSDWWLVLKDEEQLAMFAHSMDAHRFAIAMLHDGLASSVRLASSVLVEA